MKSLIRGALIASAWALVVGCQSASSVQDDAATGQDALADALPALADAHVDARSSDGAMRQDANMVDASLDAVAQDAEALDGAESLEDAEVDFALDFALDAGSTGGCTSNDDCLGSPTTPVCSLGTGQCIASSDATLGLIEASAGVLSPSFDPGTTHYDVEVLSGESSITLSALINDDHATIRYRVAGGEYVDLASGAPSAPITVSAIATTVELLVTAQDGVTTATYVLSIRRVSDDARLAALRFSSGVLRPGFVPNVTDYVVWVINDVASVTMTATTEDDEASVAMRVGSSGAFMPITSGVTTSSIGLMEGANIVEVQVTPAASSASPRTYRITINRRPEWYTQLTTFGPISSLQTSTSQISERSGVLYTYDAEGVDGATVSTDVRAVFASGSVAWAAGAASGTMTSGVASTIPLAPGDNVITLTHTLSSVSTVYTIHIRRAGTFNSMMIVTSGVTLTPAFDPDVHEYEMSAIAYDAVVRYIVASTFNEAGYLQCDHCDWWQYEARGPQPYILGAGENVIDWQFWPGVSGLPIEHYYVHVTRASVFEGPVSAITLSNATLTERRGELYTFDATSVGKDVPSTDLTLSFALGTATWSTGVASGSLVSGVPSTIPLERGYNTITVTYSEGGHDTVFRIYITREGVFESMIYTTPGVTLTPDFDPGVYEYTLTDVPYETARLTYRVASSFDEAGYLQCDHCDWWQYEGRGEQSLVLTPGDNVIDWMFNSQAYGGTVTHYYVHVHRGLAFGTHLNALSFSNATITETRGELYQFTSTAVASNVTTTDVTATFDHGTATWSVGSMSGALSSGVPATVPLDYGYNDIEVTHSFMGHDTVYHVRFLRSGIFTNMEFTTPGVTMTPAFDTDVHQYTLSDVPYETARLTYIVSETFNEAGYLQCNHCDWWQFESRNEQSLYLDPGPNCIDWMHNSEAYGGTVTHYYVKVNRGPVMESYTCP